MKIVVCIKQVPDTTEIKLDPVTGTMIRDGVPSIMNPDDKGGLEMALALKDKYGAQVTVITMGPPQADDILREAFAMGADRAIHLSDRLPVQIHWLRRMLLPVLYGCWISTWSLPAGRRSMEIRRR